MTSADVLSRVGNKWCSIELDNPLQAQIVCLWFTDCRYLIMQKPAAFSKLVLVARIDIRGIIFLPHHLIWFWFVFFFVSVVQGLMSNPLMAQARLCFSSVNVSFIHSQRNMVAGNYRGHHSHSPNNRVSYRIIELQQYSVCLNVFLTLKRAFQLPLKYLSFLKTFWLSFSLVELNFGWRLY